MTKTITLITALLLTGTLAAQEEFFSESGEFTADGDSSANRHVIPVEAGTVVEVIVIGNGVDTTLNATLPNGETIHNDDYQELDAGFVRKLADSGELEVVAAPLSSGTTGGYRVVARTLPAPESIEIGDTVEGLLDAGAGDRYVLSGSAGTRVAIDLKSYDFDALLTVVDAEGNESSDDDGGDEGYNSRLHYRFDDDETITITAGSVSSSNGRYKLIVNELSSEPTEQLSSRLSADSPRGHDGTRFERHELEGEAGDTVTVQLDSDAFDAVLFVSNPDGSNLTRDDDGGDDNNSLITTTLPESGTYAIYVTSFGNSTGDYELTIYR